MNGGSCLFANRIELLIKLKRLRTKRVKVKEIMVEQLEPSGQSFSGGA